MDNKKILLYGGISIALGAVGFFVWSFFQKVNIPLDEKNTILSDKEPTIEISKYFESLMDTKFEPIKTPNIFYNSTNNLLR